MRSLEPQASSYTTRSDSQAISNTSLIFDSNTTQILYCINSQVAAVAMVFVLVVTSFRISAKPASE